MRITDVIRHFKQNWTRELCHGAVARLARVCPEMALMLKCGCKKPQIVLEDAKRWL